MVDVADKNAFYRHEVEEDERITTTRKPYPSSKPFGPNMHMAPTPSIGTTTAPSTTYSLSPDPGASEISSSPSVSKHRWYSSDKFAAGQSRGQEGSGASTTTDQDIQQHHHSSTSPISGGIERLKNFFASEKGASHSTTSHMSARISSNEESHKGYGESSGTTLKARHSKPIDSSYPRNQPPNLTSAVPKYQSSVPAPLYDYKEGVLFQRNYQWPDKKGFKDESDYTVQQSFDRDGFRETHGKMERETGDKRGMLARETWTRLGQDQEIKEEKVRFQHRGPLDELPRALPPGSKDKIMESLLGTEEYSKHTSKVLGGGPTPSIFPRFIEDVIAEGTGYLSDHSSSKKLAHESSTSDVVTTKENVIEQSYSDEYIRASGVKPPTTVRQIGGYTDGTGGSTKYYRKAFEDENITFTGPTAEAREFAKSDFESLSGGSERTFNTQGASSSFPTLPDRRHRQHESRELSEGSVVEDSYRRYKTEDLRSFNQGVSSEDQILASHPGFSSAVIPLKKHASVQYDIKPSYRVVFEKLTRRERVTEREAAEKENAATQTYATLPIKDMSVSTPSLAEPETKVPETAPPDDHDDKRYHELSKSLGDIALSIKDLNDKLKEKEREEAPTIITRLEEEDKPPIQPQKPSIPLYDDRVQSPIFRPSREEEQLAKTVQTVTDRKAPTVKVQTKAMKTRKIKKVRMEETENVLEEYPEVEIARSKYYFGDGSEATLESGKGSVSKAVQLRNGALARDVSQAYYTKAAVNGGPSNGFKQYVTYEKRASRRFQSPEASYKDEEAERSSEAGKLRSKSSHGADEIDYEMISEPRSGERIEKERESGQDRTGSSKRSKVRTETEETTEMGESIPEEVRSEDDEPEIVEFYKKTQTHKHKKIVIKPDGAGGTEKIITENIYDPPIITTNHHHNTSSSTSSRKGGATESANRDRGREDERKSYRSNSSHSGAAGWSGSRTRSGATRTVSSPHGSSSRNVPVDLGGIDNDSGIMNSPPYPATLSPAGSLGSTYRDQNGDSSIHYVPHRFRRSAWQQQASEPPRWDTKRGKSLNRATALGSEGRRRDLSPEYRDWQYSTAKSRAAVGQISPQQPSNFAPSGPASGLDFVDSYSSQNRNRDYERAWEELSERQSNADDTEDVWRRDNSFGKGWDDERRRPTAYKETTTGSDRRPEGRDVSSRRNGYTAVSTNFDRDVPRNGHLKSPAHGMQSESYYQQKFKYSPDRDGRRPNGGSYRGQVGRDYRNGSDGRPYPAYNDGSKSEPPLLSERELKIERVKDPSVGYASSSGTRDRTTTAMNGHQQGEFQPSFYIPTVPVHNNYKDERSLTSANLSPNSTTNLVSSGTNGFQKFEESPTTEWRNSFRDPKTGMMVEEEGRRSNSKFSQMSRKDSPERRSSPMKDFSKKFFPKNNYDNKYQIKAHN